LGGKRPECHGYFLKHGRGTLRGGGAVIPVRREDPIQKGLKNWAQEIHRDTCQIDERKKKRKGGVTEEGKEVKGQTGVF